MDPTKVQSIIDGLQTALVTDAASPQPSYSLDGKSVSRNEWREGLQRQLIEWNKVLIQLNPYIISTCQRL